MAAVRTIVSCVILLGIFAVWTGTAARAAEPRRTEPTVRVESAKVLVHERINLLSGASAVYSLESGPSGFSKLRVNVLGDSRIPVRLLDSRNYSLYKSGSHFDSLPFTTENVRHLRFFYFDVPGAGTYHLVVGPLSEGSSRKVIVFATGIYDHMPEDRRRLLDLYRGFYESVEKSFVFPEFSITVGGCGEENAFSVPNIFICNEFLAGLPREEHGYLAVWVASHELGHNLLKAWGSPLWDDEASADELGSVILSLTPYRMPVVEAVSGLLNGRQRMRRLVNSQRWRLLIQRARRTAGWLAYPEELRAKWAAFLMPHVRGKGPLGLRGCYPEAENETSPRLPGLSAALPGFRSSLYIPDFMRRRK